CRSSTRSSPTRPSDGRDRGRGGGMTAIRRPGRRRGGGPLGGEWRWALLFLAPTLVGLAVLSAGPILATLAISLTNWDLLTAPKLVGLDNFVELASDERFGKALRNTAFYTLTS